MSSSACLAIGAAVLSLASAGCAGLLGLDSGVSDGADASAGNDSADPPDAVGDTGPAALGDGPALDARDGSPTSAVDGCGSTQSDPLNCGSCNHACAQGASSHATCTAGMCGLSCLGGALDCDHQASDGCECMPVPNGAASCGSGGACGHVCDQDYVDCAGKPCSCGGGKRCLSDHTCGVCRTPGQPCQTGTDCCSGACAAILNCL